MKRQAAGMIFLGICVAPAILLIKGVLTPVVSGAIFASALVVLGGASLNFTRT